MMHTYKSRICFTKGPLGGMLSMDQLRLLPQQQRTSHKSQTTTWPVVANICCKLPFWGQHRATVTIPAWISSPWCWPVLQYDLFSLASSSFFYIPEESPAHRILFQSQLFEEPDPEILSGPRWTQRGIGNVSPDLKGEERRDLGICS